MPARLPFALALVLAAVPAGRAVAQDPVDRRTREKPEVVPRAGDGRHGTCDVLRFTAGGDTLFAAGDDKVLTGWRHGDTGLDTEPAKTEVLRWPAWREQIGGVKSFDLSADGTRVAVGGLGLRTSNVAVVERGRLDGVTKQLLTWPTAPAGGGHFGAVLSVVLSSDAKTVAFGTQDGSVWLWRPEERKEPDAAGCWCNRPLWVGARFLRDVPVPGKENPRKEYDAPKLVFFRDRDTKLIAVGERGTVTEYAVADTTALGTAGHRNPAEAKPLFNVNDGAGAFPVLTVVPDLARNRIVVASDGTNRVLIRTLDGTPATVLKLPANHFARSLAVHPKTGVLAVAVATVVPARDKRPQFHNDADDALYLYAAPATRPAPDRIVRFRGQADALTFHPTLNRLAVAGGDADEVTVFALGDPTTPPRLSRWVPTAIGLLPAGFDNATWPMTTVRGSGRRVWELAIGADGSAIGMRTRRDPTADQPNGRGAGGWNWMDLNKLMPSAAPRKWEAAVTTADGWTVEPDAKNRDQWYAVHGGTRLELNYNTLLFNKPTCFTFLKATSTAPTRLLVGHYYGAALFELPARPGQSGPLPPKREYVGQSGEVLCIAAVDDAKGGWFVTGGADHTVAAYHLGDWNHNANLGVSFEEEGQSAKLVVTAVAVGSPGWEAGLQAGDQVLLLAVGGQRPPVYDGRPEAKPVPGGGKDTPFVPDERAPGEPARDSESHRKAALSALRTAAPVTELYFRVRSKNGASRDMATSVKQRPLWKLYPTFTPDDRPAEWVAWMWRDSYFQTTSPNGDGLVGWHLNAPTPNFTPRFHPLGHYKGYQRDDLVRALIRDRDLAATLDRIRTDPNKPTASIGGGEPAPIRVEVDRTEIEAKAVTVRVRIDRRASDVDQLPERVELWVNDHRYGEWPHDPQRPFDRVLELPPGVFRSDDKRADPSPDNVLTVQAYTPAGGRATATRHLINRNLPPPPKLLGLAVGVDDYSDHRKVSGERGLVGNLKYAVADTDLVTDSFAVHVGAKRHFPAGKLGVAKNAAVVREQLLADLAALKASANPNDLLILFMAGHGQLVGRNGRVTEVIPDAVTDPEKTYKEVRFAFCCSNFDTAKPGDAVITADKLFEALAAINCRKMVLLDVCRSGWATRRDVVRQFAPNGLGPFVLAACGPGQSSVEDETLRHGLFTAALTEAITSGAKANAAFHLADANRDGMLSCQELFDYVHRRVTEVRKDQTPTCFPARADLPRTVVVSTRR